MSPTSTSGAGALRLAGPADRLSTLPPWPWTDPVDRAAPRTLGFAAAEWAEKWLYQPNGPRAGKKFRLTQGQLDFLLWWYAIDDDGRWLYTHGVRRLAKGSGKALALDTPLATPSGWTTMGDVRVGDELVDEHGTPTTVVGLSDVMHGRPCYRVTFRDGTSVVADAGHLWPMDEFHGSRKRRRVTVTTEQLADVTFARPLTTGKTRASRSGVARWRTLPTPIIDGPEVDLPIPAYLLGYWLGDGDSDCPRLTVHHGDVPHVLGQMDLLGIEYGGQQPTGPNTSRIRFGHGWAHRALREAGLLHNKHVPAVVMRASYKQRLDVLRGLLDSDGTVSKIGAIEFCVTSRRLAEGFVELARTLGLYPRMRHSDAVLNGRAVGDRYRVCLTAYADQQVFALPRKAARLKDRPAAIPYSHVRTVVAVEPVDPVPVRCVTVSGPSSLYLAGEGLVPTHNSPFAAVVALIEFCGPVRPEATADTVPGRVIGTAAHMPLVQIAATAESQTANTMRMVRAFASKGSEVAREHKLDPGKTRYYKLPEGTLEVITSSATAVEGAESSFVVGDETEHWKPSNGGPELSATLQDNLAKSGSRMLETCNAWVPGVESVAEESWEAWLAQEEGRTRGETKMLYDARIAPADVDMADPDRLRDALEYVYADCPWVDVRTIMERIWSPKARRDDSKRKYLNQPTAAADAWVELEEWKRLADPSVKVDPDEPVVLFFDGSKSRDATALVGCTLDAGHVFTIGVWEPDPGDPNDTVSAPEVDLAVEQTFQRLNVVAFFADVREWEQFALTSWPERYKDRLRVWAAPSARPPQPVAWDMRGHSYEFAKATEACHAEIVDGSFTHDGDSRTTRHVGNARRRPYRDAVAVGKESPDSRRKIDAAVCVIGARMVRRIVQGSGKKLGPKKPSKVVVLA
jgi:hypothetical protein